MLLALSKSKVNLHYFIVNKFIIFLNDTLQNIIQEFITRCFNFLMARLNNQYFNSILDTTHECQ